MVAAGSPFAFQLSEIAAGSRQKLFQVLDSKKAEAVRLVVAGIPDKNELAKLLGTLNKAAHDVSLKSALNEAVDEISKNFEL